jgi:hypothetical protein
MHSVRTDLTVAGSGGAPVGRRGASERSPDPRAISATRSWRRVESALRNHLNCGIVGTLMRGGGIGATLEAFPIPLGSVT